MFEDSHSDEVVPEPHLHHKASHHKKLKKNWLLMLTVLLIVLAGSSLAYYKLVYSGHFPYKIRKQLDIVLYYPLKPPTGMKVDRTSFQVPAKNVVTYKITDSQNQAFYISVQHLPTNLDFEAFKARFHSTDEFTTAAGSALFGDAGNYLQVSIPTTTSSWILITTSDFTGQSELHDLARSLVRTR